MSDQDILDQADIFSTLVRGVSSISEMEMVRFADEVTVAQEFTADQPALLTTTAASTDYARGSTSLYDAMGTAHARLAARSPLARLLIVATDGQDNSSTVYDRDGIIGTLAASSVFVLMLGNQYASLLDMRELAGDRGAFIYTYALADIKAKALFFIEALQSAAVVRIGGAAASATQLRVEVASKSVDFSP